MAKFMCHDTKLVTFLKKKPTQIERKKSSILECSSLHTLRFLSDCIFLLICISEPFSCALGLSIWLPVRSHRESVYKGIKPTGLVRQF